MEKDTRVVFQTEIKPSLNNLKLTVLFLTLLFLTLLLTNIFTIKLLNSYKESNFSIGKKLSEISVLASNVTLSPDQPKDLPSNTRLLLEKPIEGGHIAAYRFDRQWLNKVNSTGFYAVVLEAGDYWSQPLFFPLNSTYGGKEVFDVVGNQVLFLNGQTNMIDVYEYQVAQTGSSTSDSFVYKKSIAMPNNNVGSVYYLSCNSSVCTVKTAFSMESGCSMNLSLNSFIYSNIECSNMEGNFIP